MLIKIQTHATICFTIASIHKLIKISANKSGAEVGLYHSKYKLLN